MMLLLWSWTMVRILWIFSARGTCSLTTVIGIKRLEIVEKVKKYEM